jgi:hypothetical protein
LNRFLEKAMIFIQNSVPGRFFPVAKNKIPFFSAHPSLNLRSPLLDAGEATGYIKKKN